MHTPLSYLANGWADCAQILYVNRDPFDNSFTHAWGGVRLHVRTRTPRFPDLANGWVNCVQILCVNRDPLDNWFAHVWCGMHLHVRTCTLRFPDLANGWADRVQILCVNRDPLDNCFAHVWRGVHLHVRTCTPRFPDLANGWANCVQILCVNRDQLDYTHKIWTRSAQPFARSGKRSVHVRTCRCIPHQTCANQLSNGSLLCFTHVWGGVHLHVRTCTPFFHILQTAGRIASKFGAWLWIHDGCVLHMWRRGCICACARADPLSIPATRTTNLRSAALPQKRCLTGNRRLVEHETTTIR